MAPLLASALDAVEYLVDPRNVVGDTGPNLRDQTGRDVLAVQKLQRSSFRISGGPQRVRMGKIDSVSRHRPTISAAPTQSHRLAIAAAYRVWQLCQCPCQAELKTLLDAKHHGTAADVMALAQLFGRSGRPASTTGTPRVGCGYLENANLVM